MKSLIEVRTLTLKSGTRNEFHRLFTQESLPILQRWKIDVVAHGPSLHDEDTYYVIRRFDNLAQREQREDSFYGSDDWRKGPRQALLALIENYVDVVFELEEGPIQGLRK
ncbi:MAG TPA: NIPSNAP family protein [Anaerolineales bacterium]|nr:NIPSNAP family protein [Anaerolineales bacterium]